MLNLLKSLLFKNPFLEDKESVRYTIDAYRRDQKQEDLETKFVTGSGNVFADSGIDEPTAFTKSVKLSASNKKPETLKLDHLTKRQLEGIAKSTELALSLSENSKEILQLERTLKVFKKALEKKVSGK
jgi:hypothetical protein